MHNGEGGLQASGNRKTFVRTLVLTSKKSVLTCTSNVLTCSHIFVRTPIIGKIFRAARGYFYTYIFYAHRRGGDNTIQEVNFHLPHYECHICVK